MIMKKIFLDNLPKRGNTNQINWKASIGYKVKFIYDDIKGEIEIVDYDGKYLYIRYQDDKPFKIYYGGLQQCCLGKLLNKITKEFKVEIGQTFKDNKRDLTIIDREYRPIVRENGYIENKKWYKYKCNVCGYDEGWIVEEKLSEGNGCSCCHGFTIVEGINDIPTTAPWMVKFFQGGYDEAKLYTEVSGQKIYPVCHDCGRIKNKSITISTIYRDHSIGCICSDSISYSEKIMYSVLEQIGLDFITQLNKTTFKWCQEYRYDFYFKYNDESYIIETHGIQHYKNSKRGRTLEKEQENDKIKYNLAIKNGIKKDNYIVINCRTSGLEWIKNNVLKNKELNELFNLSKIDWLKCEEFALSNLVKQVCDLKKDNSELTITDIVNITKLSRSTIWRYLKKGTKLGWCNYNPKEEMDKNNKNTGIQIKNILSKPVEMFKDNISQGIFLSARELSTQSEHLFNIKLDNSSIGRACKSHKTYKGYEFKYK